MHKIAIDYDIYFVLYFARTCASSTRVSGSLPISLIDGASYFAARVKQRWFPVAIPLKPNAVVKKNARNFSSHFLVINNGNCGRSKILTTSSWRRSQPAKLRLSHFTNFIKYWYLRAEVDPCRQMFFIYN